MIPPRPARRSRALGIAAAALVVISAPTATAQRPVPEALRFDAERAWSYLTTQVRFGPRIPGTPAHARQLGWMRDFFAQRADSVAVQRFAFQPLAGGASVPMANLLARFRPAAPERVLLVAHWDTRPRADAAPDPAERTLPVPGANDGASGVAVLMELANALRATPPPLGVDLLLTDGEDYGTTDDEMYLGARYFAATLPPNYRPRYALVLDMVGDSAPSFPVEELSRRAAPKLVRRIRDTAGRLGYGAFFPDSSAGEILDDHVPLIEAGLPAAVLIDLDYGPDNSLWHTPRDLPAQTSPETLRMVGEVVLALLYGEAAGGPEQ